MDVSPSPTDLPIWTKRGGRGLSYLQRLLVVHVGEVVVKLVQGGVLVLALVPAILAVLVTHAEVTREKKVTHT